MAANLNSTAPTIETPTAKNMTFAILVSRWNYDVTDKLRLAAIETLTNAGCPLKNIITKWVPGTFELPFAAQLIAETTDVDAIIALGCVIKGETPHFEYVCIGATNGIMQVQINEVIPITFGVITTINEQQALDRAGGKVGNKGEEAALTAIHMVALTNEMTQDASTIAGNLTANLS